MTLATIADRQVHVDEEGFLTDPSEWDEQLAEVLAAAIGIAELTPEHWRAITFCRADHAVRGQTPTLRRIATFGGIPTADLFRLFPAKPAKKLAYVSGLPKPVGCV
ncbi:MAG: TusE/DsrC/DsvC family sulfur relay protein [Actinomycetes bacterium]